MDDKLLKLLENMSININTTVAHLYGVLVRQAPISGAIDLALCIAIVVASVWWVRVVLVKTTCPDVSETNRYPSAEWRNDGAFLAWVIAIIANVLAIIYVIVSSRWIAAAFLNPEYWALMKLLQRCCGGC